MYVCLCNGITDKTIKKAVENGCDSLADLREQMDIADQCGKCRKHAVEVIQQSKILSDKENGLLIAAFA